MKSLRSKTTKGSFFLAKFWPILLFSFLVLLFFKPFFLDGRLPIPADTIVGMYHPWRDFYAKEYPSGIPFKNFLITDPVRQQYVWRQLSIDLLKQGQLPLWNPYQFSGTPLLASFQSAPFYPLNVLFFILPFNLSWGILVALQPFLAGIFLYAYLRHLKIGQWGSLFAGLIFSFSGFSIAWLEWNTVLHTTLWLPLILLSIDKIFSIFLNSENLKLKNQNEKSKSKIKNLLLWSSIFVISMVSSFFAGHLQIFFYLLIFSVIYLFIRWWQLGKMIKTLVLFAICYLLFTIITSIQWLPTLQFINLSARTLDQINWRQPGWFIPWQNLLQFFSPDLFGNPATLNYWGEWNYAEFLGYVGILPLIFAILAIIWRRDKKTWFFGGTVIVSLIFALPTPLAKIPYQWQIPFISTSQPTRLLFLTDFSLSILAALGLDWFIRSLNDSNHLKKFIRTILPFGAIFLSLWFFIFFGQNWLKTVTPENLSVAKRNLILPSILFVSSTLLLFAAYLLKGKKGLLTIIYIIVVGLVVFDLFRFGWKFIPFTKSEWLFPQTETIKFLKNQPGPFRLMTTDRRIFPPNFATFYRLEDVSGYDPLYLRTYGELVAAWNRGEPDISPFVFNRILTPQDYSSRVADLLNVKYVLSLKDESSTKLKLVFQEGQTRIYENKEAFPRAFLVYDYKIAKDSQESINLLFDKTVDLRKTAILEAEQGRKLEGEDRESQVEIISLQSQEIVIRTKSQKPAILILADNFYPGWQAFLDGKEESEKTFRVDFTLRGIIVPEGEHKIEFYPSL